MLIVELANGAVDTIIYAPPGRTLSDGGMKMDGRLGFIRRRGQTDGAGGTHRRPRASPGQSRAHGGGAGLDGKVIRLSAPEERLSRIWVDTALPTGDRLAGEWIAIANDGEQNAFYQIESVERDGEGSVISLGDVSLVRGYKDERDYGQGAEDELRARRPVRHFKSCRCRRRKTKIGLTPHSRESALRVA